MIEWHISVEEWFERLPECEERILAANGAGLSDDELHHAASMLLQYMIEFDAVRENAGVISVGGNRVNYLTT